MEGYSVLRSRVQTFLNQNPDVQTVTLTRPKIETKVTYKNGRAESFGRMPETCPVLRECIDTILNDGAVITPTLRDTLFNAIYNQVTDKFRDALSDVCNEKHEALKAMRAVARSLTEKIEQLETEDEAATRDESNRRARGEVVVQVATSDEKRAVKIFNDDEDGE
jgi:hypothetical protein